MRAPRLLSLRLLGLLSLAGPLSAATGAHAEPAPPPACAAEAPPASPPAQQISRGVVEGQVELPLAGPLAPAAAVCLWSVSADAPALQVLPTTPCLTGATHCARLALAPDRDPRTFDVKAGDTWLRVTVPAAQSPHSRGLLFGLVLLGLLVSVVLTTWLTQQGRVWRLRRTWTDLDTRLRHCAEDRHEIRLRIQATLSFVKNVLFRGFIPSLRDLDLATEQLREADQLLRLSERKTLLWTRADARNLPPSALRRFHDELRLFDREILQLPLPLEESAFEAAVPEALKRAGKLLTETERPWDADNQALLAELKTAGIHAVETLTEFPALPPFKNAVDLFKDQVNLELGRLSALTAALQGGDPTLFPPARFEADLRLELVRCLSEACRHLQREAEADQSLTGPPDADAEPSVGGPRNLYQAHFTNPDTLRRLRRAFRAWRGVDPTREAAREVHRDLIRLLRWEPENAVLRDWLSGPEKPAVRAASYRNQWRTFTPETLALHVLDREHQNAAEDYYWRTQIEVAWGCITPDKRVYFGGWPLQVAADNPAPSNAAPQAGHRWYVSRGPSNMAFVAEPGDLQLEAWVRAPREDAAAPHPWRPLGRIDLSVQPSVAEGQAAQVLATGYVRLLLSLLATSLLSPAIVAQAAQEPNGVLSVLLALLLPLGIDQGSVAATSGLKGLGDALGRLRIPKPPAT